MTTRAPTQVPVHEQSSGIAVRVNIGRVLCVMVPLTVWFVPLNIDAPARHGLAISSFMILAWITEAMEYALSGLIGCYLYWALRVAPFNVASSRFATDTPFLLALDRNSLGTVLNDLFGGCRENSMVGSRFDLYLSSA